MKYPFSIALFGAGYLYETSEGVRDARFSSLNEERFWSGRNLKLVADSSGKSFLKYVMTSSDQENGMTAKKRYNYDWNAKYQRGNWKIKNDESSTHYSTV